MSFFIDNQNVDFINFRPSDEIEGPPREEFAALLQALIGGRSARFEEIFDSISPIRPELYGDMADPTVGRFSNKEAIELLHHISRYGLDVSLLYTIFSEIKRCSELSSSEIVQIGLNAHPDGQENSNIELISAVIVDEPDFQEKIALAQTALKELFARNRYAEAEWLRNMLQDITAPKDRAAALKVFYEQVSIFFSYLKWSSLEYSPERFSGLDQHFFAGAISADYAFPLVDGAVASQLSSIASVASPLVNRAISRSGHKEWIQQSNLDLRLLEHPECIEFLRRGNISERLEYINTPIVFEQDVPVICLKNKKLSLFDLVDQFEIRDMFFGRLNSPGIFKKNTHQEWDFLNEGFVPHSKNRDLACVKTGEPTGTYQISFISLDHGDTETPEGIQRFLLSHAWVQLSKPDGTLYSVGRFATGEYISPDHYERKDMNKHRISFDVTESQFDDIQKKIELEMRNAASDFNVVQKNCSTFAGAIAAEILGAPERSFSRSTIGEHLRFENRIKIFAVAQELSQFLFESKQRFEEYFEFGLFHGIVVFIPGFDMIVGDAFLEAITPALSFVLGPKDKALVQVFNERLYKEIAFIMRKTAGDGQKELRSKLFNLFSDILEAAKDMPVDHPHTLYLNLKSHRAATVSKVARQKKSRTIFQGMGRRTSLEKRALSPTSELSKYPSFGVETTSNRKTIFDQLVQGAAKFRASLFREPKKSSCIYSIGSYENNEWAPNLGTYVSTDVVLLNKVEDTFEMKKAVISAATKSLEISFNFAGGDSFDELLSCIENRMTLCPELVAHLILSADLLKEENRARLHLLQMQYPDRFVHLITDRIYRVSPWLLSEENHVKVLIVDGTYFVMGGSGVADAMVREAWDASNQQKPLSLSERLLNKAFRDSDLAGRGVLARTMRNQFFNLFHIWELRTHGQAHHRYFDVEKTTAQCPLFDAHPERILDASVKFVVGGPEHREANPITRELADIFERAKSDIHIANLGFSPVGELKKSLVAAKNRGIDITGYFNGNKNTTIVSRVATTMPSRPNYDLLTQVFEYNVPNQLYHKKVATVDEDMTVIGSFNLGIKSQLCDYESICVIKDRRVNAAVKQVLNEDRKRSDLYAPQQVERSRSIGESIKNFLGSLLA